jgi:hypothetical protein
MLTGVRSLSVAARPSSHRKASGSPLGGPLPSIRPVDELLDERAPHSIPSLRQD